MALSTPLSIKGATSDSIDAEVSSISSGSLVTLSTNAIVYNNVKTSPYGMLEFDGYAHTSLGDWPDFEPSTWGTFASSYHQTNQFGLDAEGFASMEIKRDDNNNRMEIKTYSGTAAAMATVYTNYINYTGMSGGTFSIKYNQSSGINSGNNGSSNNNPLEAGYNVNQYYTLANNGERQFKWIAQRTYSGGDGFARVTAIDMVFTLKITVGGVDYTTSSTSRGVSVSARRGLEP